MKIENKVNQYELVEPLVYNGEHIFYSKITHFITKHFKHGGPTSFFLVVSRVIGKL